jgi:hypothetical protein
MYFNQKLTQGDIGNYLVDVPNRHELNNGRVHSDSGDFSALASFCAFFQKIDGATDEFGKLAQRWNNRLVLEGLSLPELYLNRRIAIALVVDIGPCADPGFPRLADYSSIGRPDANEHEDSAGGTSRRVVFLILSNGEDDMTRLGNCLDKHPMLIHSVKVIERSKSVLAATL